MAKAIAIEACSKHEVLIALNALLSESIKPIKYEFKDLLPQDNIKIWYAPGPVSDNDPQNCKRRIIAELIREAFFESLNPDVIFIPSLFEGYDSDAVTSIGAFDKKTPVVAAIHDITPLVNYNIVLSSAPLLKKYYFRKLDYLKSASAWLSVSKYTAMDVEKNLGLDKSCIYTTHEGFDGIFKKIDKDIADIFKNDIKKAYGIEKKFLLYTGMIDNQKNIHRLIEAYSKLSLNLRMNYQLVFAGNIPSMMINQIKFISKQYGLNENDVIFTGYVSDEKLALLYNLCSLFVFPSLYEGFGLPPLEAMACGAPVIASNVTSLPEVVGRDEALFNPYSVDSITEKITYVLENDNFRDELSRENLERAAKFSWKISAKKAIEVFEKFDDIKKINISSENFKITETGIFKRKYSRILVIKLDHMCDFILAIPALTKLKTKYPYSSIDIIIGSWNKPIAEKLGIFSNIYEFDYFKKKSLMQPSFLQEELDLLINQIGFYDIAIDLRRNSDTRFILTAINSPLKVGYQTHDSTIDSKLDVIVPHELDRALNITGLNKKSMAVQMLDIIDSLPNDVNDYTYLPEMTHDIDSNEISINLNEIAVFPFAGSDAKEWGRDNFEKLIKMLSLDERIDNVNIYFSNDYEKARLKPENANAEKLKIYTGLSFEELISSLNKNILCISNSSFGAHMASYLGLYSLMICGGTLPVQEWAPVFGKSFAVYKPVPCYPCYIKSNEDCRFNFACFESITPEKIYDIIMNIVISFKNCVKPNIKNSDDFNVCSLNELKLDEKLIDLLIAEIGRLCDFNDDNDYLTELAVCIEKLFNDHR